MRTTWGRIDIRNCFDFISISKPLTILWNTKRYTCVYHVDFFIITESLIDVYTIHLHKLKFTPRMYNIPTWSWPAILWWRGLSRPRVTSNVLLKAKILDQILVDGSMDTTLFTTCKRIVDIWWSVCVYYFNWNTLQNLMDVYSEWPRSTHSLPVKMMIGNVWSMCRLGVEVEGV